MKSVPKISPQKICENILIEIKRKNTERNIWPSENLIADRLLRRGVELSEAYEELYSKLYESQFALETLLGLVLNTAVLWNPERISEARCARDELAAINQQIASRATELAELLEQRSDLHNTSGFSSDTHYSVCGVIDAAAKGNHLFKGYVQERIQALRGQFDLKYWPSLSEFFQEVAYDAQNARIEATDPMTAAATIAVRCSLADFFKALFVLIEENSPTNHGHLPRDFKLTDNTLASLANCALDLGPDDLVDGPYVKRLRQRERNATSDGRGAA